MDTSSNFDWHERRSVRGGDENHESGGCATIGPAKDGGTRSPGAEHACGTWQASQIELETNARPLDDHANRKRTRCGDPVQVGFAVVNLDGLSPIDAEILVQHEDDAAGDRSYRIQRPHAKIDEENFVAVCPHQPRRLALGQ